MHELQLLLTASGIEFTTYNDFVNCRRDLSPSHKWAIRWRVTYAYVYSLDRGEWRVDGVIADAKSIVARVVEIEGHAK